MQGIIINYRMARHHQKPNHAKIQILDVPGIVRGASIGTGRGKEVLSVVQSADLVVFLVDVNHPEHYPILQKELYDKNVRVNQIRPDVKITKTGKDGLKIASTVPLRSITRETIKSILGEFKIINADVVIREDITPEQLIDCIENNKQYLPGITVINKIDSVDEKTARKVAKQVGADLAISAQKRTHLEELKQFIFDKLNLIRIYMKEPRKDPDMDVPLIGFRDMSIRDICNKLHKDFVKKFRFCRVWGKSAKFPGQKLKLKHVVKDGDIVEIHLR